MFGVFGRAIPPQAEAVTTDSIRCGQCCTKKPRAAYVKGDRVLKTCLRCRQSKEKSNRAKPRKTARRRRIDLPQTKDEMVPIQVIAQPAQNYSTQPVFTQSIKPSRDDQQTVATNHKEYNQGVKGQAGESWATLTFDVFDTQKHSSRSEIGQVVRYQTERQKFGWTSVNEIAGAEKRHKHGTNTVNDDILRRTIPSNIEEARRSNGEHY